MLILLMLKEWPAMIVANIPANIASEDAQPAHLVPD